MTAERLNDIKQLVKSVNRLDSALYSIEFHSYHDSTGYHCTLTYTNFPFTLRSTLVEYLAYGKLNGLTCHGVYKIGKVTKMFLS